MEMKLKVLEGSQVGAEVPVPGPKFFVGRGEDCHLRPRSEMVSRHHCVLLVEQGYAGVRDFGSKNGTYVNGERVVGERALTAGDTLSVGPLKFEVMLAHTLGGPKRPKVKNVKEAASRSAAQAGQGDQQINDWLSDTDDDTFSPGRETTDADASRVRLGEEIAAGETATMDAQQATNLIRQSEEQTRIDVEPAQPAPNTPPGASADESKSKDTQSAAMNVLRQYQKHQKHTLPKKK
jgi:pSer/pThr/pTyr-binding forkhead associated (FHA) protein